MVFLFLVQVITFEEAERRGRIYDAEGMTYLFDLDYNDGDCPFTVDARSYGNVSHFVNHSVCLEHPSKCCLQYFKLRINYFIMSTPLGGGYIIFAFCAVRCPASRMVSAHLKEKY